MSGGSLDYICYKLSTVADHIPDMEIKDLVFDISNLLHDLEWFLSGDYCEGTWLKSASDFRKKWLRGNSTERLQRYVETMLDSNRKELMEMVGLAMHCEDCEKFTQESDCYGKCKDTSQRAHHYFEPSCKNFVPKEI